MKIIPSLLGSVFVFLLATSCCWLPWLVVLLGGMRVLSTNFDNSNYGVFTARPGVLTNYYYVNILDLNTVWSTSDQLVFQGIIILQIYLCITLHMPYYV
jgi:hypothetical protein